MTRRTFKQLEPDPAADAAERESVGNFAREHDPWHEVGGSGEPAFQNSWVNYGAPYANTRFRKIHGVVHVQFAVKLGTTGAAVFTLPAGYRPDATIGGTWCYEANGDLLINMTVDANGVVAIVGSAGNTLSFGSFSFPADQ